MDLPVYSISSQGNGGDNMHLIIYVTAISMKPKRFICAVFHGTRTLENIQEHGEFVLQLLARPQYRLVDLLGKKSGWQVDKISRLDKRGALTSWRGFRVLQDCLALLHLRVTNSLEGGDHRVFVCDLLAYKNLQDGPPLTLDDLRARKLVRM